MKALIADDEPLLAIALKSALAEAWPELEIGAVVPNGLQAVEAAERLKPEVAFLDIQMPGMTGLEAAEEIVERMGDAQPAIVFVTAYDEHALKAFELAAADYVLKPVTVERLARTVERLKRRRSDPDIAAQLRQLLAVPRAAQPLTQIRAGTGNTVRMIPLEEVCYFQSSDKYTTVVTPDGEVLLRMPLKDLVGQLPGGRFQQIHRGTVVNLADIAAAVRDETGRVSLQLRRRKERLPVSRIYSDLFKAM
jgi:DNA-binding LytR/AlgR family response regulator